MKYIKKATKFTILIVLLFIIFNIAAYSYAYLSPKLQIKSANKFMLFDQDNELFFQGSGDSKWVSLDNISDNVVKTTIETEDKNFYKHPGYDMVGLARSMVANVLAGHVVQGASTITQQLSRILFLSNEKTFTRKIKELQVAAQIEKTISKDKILEMYLNNVYLGSGAYGVKGAARIYFNKNLNQLTLPERDRIRFIKNSAP